MVILVSEISLISLNKYPLQRDVLVSILYKGTF